MISELHTFTETELQEIDLLMHELSPHSSCSEQQLRTVTDNPNSHLYVWREEGHIVACATLCISHTPELTLGGIEAVVVSSACRGKGYGKLLMRHLLKEAKDLGCHKLHLTSRPTRVAANRLYQSLGFVKHETNCYNLHF